MWHDMRSIAVKGWAAFTEGMEIQKKHAAKVASQERITSERGQALARATGSAEVTQAQCEYEVARKKALARFNRMMAVAAAKERARGGR